MLCRRNGVLLIIFLAIAGVYSTVCPTTGCATLTSCTGAGPDPETGVAILLTYNTGAGTRYTVGCCGFVNSWDTISSCSGSLDAQVWRLISGTSYTYVGYNTLTLNGATQTHTITNGQRIRVKPGDIIGIHSLTSFCLTHNVVNAGAGATQQIKVTGLTSQMSSPFNWVTNSGDKGENNYPINAVVTYGAPTLNTSSLAGFQAYKDTLSVGTIIRTITATDSDVEDKNSLTYSLLSNGTYFKIGAGTGDITIGATLPPKGVYTLVVKVEDPCGANDTGTMIVTILNKPPVINNLNATIYISEDLPKGSLVFTVNATDLDPVTCSKVGGPTEFTVNINFGVYLASTASLDYDVTSVYYLTINCTDGEDNVYKVLTVKLIRNEPPVIYNLPSSTSFLEDLSTRTPLYTLNVTDPTNDNINCTLNTPSTLFDVSLNMNAYVIYLTGGTTLDYDTTSSYVLSVNCADHRRYDNDTFTVYLIHNTPPVINSLPNSTSISEDLATRTLLHTLNVTDVNVADNITCSLNTFTTLFEVVKISSSGNYGIFLKGGITLDYDITSSYVLSVVCGDHRRNVTGLFTVYLIRNEPPTITNLPMSCEIAEATSTETLLYGVYVTDPTNDTVTCSITSSTSIFFIKAASTPFESDIFVRSNPGFVYDTKKQYTIDISCADHRRNVSSIFYIYILRNMPPYFLNLQGKTSLSSSTGTAGKSVFTVLAGDPENDQVQFSITSKQVNAPFVINTNTGEVSLTRSIQYDSVTGYDLYVTVSDGRNVYGPSTLTVLITDINSPPMFRNLPRIVSVLENSIIGSSVFQPIIYDMNTGDSHTFSVTYSPSEGAVYFQVNKNSGLVTVQNNINYETIAYKSFQLSVTVSDSLMTDTGNLTLNIINVNEAPIFTKKYYSFSVYENVKGTALQNPYYQYNDEDGDKVKFSFNCGSNTGRLDMNSTTGFFTYAVTYDLDVAGTSATIQCEVIIKDNEYNDTAYLNITVLDTNDNSPVFVHKEYIFFVPFTTAVGTKIGQVKATDKDAGYYGNILYYLEQEVLDKGVFVIASDGTITLSGSLATVATEGSIINMTVYVVDTGGKQDSTCVYVVIPGTAVNVASTNEILYYTFFTYSKNMAWFVPLLFLMFGTVCFVAYTVWKHGCVCDCPQIKKRKGERTSHSYGSWKPWKVWERPS